MISDAQTETGMPPVVETIGTGKVGPLPVPCSSSPRSRSRLVMLARTQWGRWIYAVGGNPEARAAGRHPGRPRPAVGLRAVRARRGHRRRCSSPAGPTPASPKAGQLLELDAITAVIIGGASFFGGRGA